MECHRHAEWGIGQKSPAFGTGPACCGERTRGMNGCGTLARCIPSLGLFVRTADSRRRTSWCSWATDERPSGPRYRPVR